MRDIADFRKDIDRLDGKIVALIAARLDLCRQVAELKKRTGIPMMQPARVTEVKQRNATRGAALGVAPDFTMRLYEEIIAEACRIEDVIIGETAPKLATADDAMPTAVGPTASR